MLKGLACSQLLGGNPETTQAAGIGQGGMHFVVSAATLLLTSACFTLKGVGDTGGLETINWVSPVASGLLSDSAYSELAAWGSSSPVEYSLSLRPG